MITFRGGPLDGVVLDSQSDNGPERCDVFWILAKTRNGEQGSRFFEIGGLRSQACPVVDAIYYLAGRGEGDDMRYFEFVLNG